MSCFVQLKLAKAPADRPDLCQTGLKPVRLSQSGSLAIPELPSILSFIATVSTSLNRRNN